MMSLMKSKYKAVDLAPLLDKILGTFEMISVRSEVEAPLDCKDWSFGRREVSASSVRRRGYVVMILEI